MSSMASDSRWNVNSHRQATSGVVLRQGGHVAEMQRRRLLLAFVEVLAEHQLGERERRERASAPASRVVPSMSSSRTVTSASWRRSMRRSSDSPSQS